MKQVYTVSQINRYLKNMFRQDYCLRDIDVRGEVSNCRYAQSGHIYFTLRDEVGAIACMMWDDDRDGLRFALSDGQQVEIHGYIDIYERDGRYELIARRIVQAGMGELYEQFLRTKAELESLGMFDARFKRPIPLYIRTLGVVTSKRGAALHDIISVASRRNPYIDIVVSPAVVQGDAAPASIVSAIKRLETSGVQLIIVGRGGGSYEDLACFNDRSVAQAVFDCPVPIISAVGHETDYTIADFAADLRAPTPSAAAELAVVDIEALTDRVSRYAEVLYNREMELVGAVTRKAVEQLRSGAVRAVNRNSRRLAVIKARLAELSPEHRRSLGQPYITAAGEPLTSVTQVHAGDELQVHLTDGDLTVSVREVLAHGGT